MKTIQLHLEATLKKVFHDTYASLVVFAVRFVKEKHIAEDIVQQLFYKLYMEKKTFDDHDRMSSYLYKAVKNSCLNYLAHENVKNNYKIEQLGQRQQDIGDSTEIEATVLLHNAIKKLSERRRQVIGLHLKGYDNKIIASRLNITLQTVKNLKRKAYQDLRNYLKVTR